ncbi:Oligosaccharide translocation protein rft1 [Microbotryomycetes sp. JL221]|nr:Oligosaccharide translocation protein rft1 [Microbotryomycetes sp. JL221]
MGAPALSQTASSSVTSEPQAHDTSAQREAATSPLFKTTLSLVALQLVSRVFSFALNQLLLRSTTAEALGVATIGFDVLRDTSLFLAREGVRGAIIRARKIDLQRDKATYSRTLFLPTLMCPLVLSLFLVYDRFATPTRTPPFFRLTLGLYTISALFELLSEPYYLVTLVNWETATSSRVRVEGFAVGAKSIATLAVVVLSSSDKALLSFGVGQAVYGLSLLIGLRTVARNAAHGSTIRWVSSSGSQAKFDPVILQTSWALTKQSLVKQLLTEGDKIAVGRLSQLEDQGGYAIALNYGSLIARILFQPLEESSRLFFSRNLAKPTPQLIKQAAHLLQSLLLLYSHLTLILVLLAPSYTTPLLYHLLGPRWVSPPSSAAILLQTYCSTYLPFLAFNGLTEAFCQSCASPTWIRRGSYWMMVCSIVFLICVYIVNVKLELGERGLIYANCVNMAMRIGFSTVFAHNFFKRHDTVDETAWKALLPAKWVPKLPTLTVFALTHVIVKKSLQRGIWITKRGMLEHVGIGAVSGLACLAVIAWTERKNLDNFKQVLMRQKTE